MTAEAPSLLHMECRPATPWTTVNISEAVPGVQTALGWTFWRDSLERGMRTSFYRVGALPRAAASLSPAAADDRFIAIFFGRVVANVKLLRDIGDRMPGTSADAMEEQLLGSKESGLTSSSTIHRYPAVALRMPAAALRSRRVIQELRRSTHHWWAEATRNPPPDLTAASELFGDALGRFEQIMGWHGFVTMMAQALYEQIGKLAVSVDIEPVAVASGYGGTDEVEVVHDLFRLSRDNLSLEEFVARHGYHGPSEGELSSRSWREDPQPINALLPAYRALGGPPDSGPGGQRQARRAELEAVMLSRLPRRRRAGARLLLSLGGSFIPLRETGKAAFLQTIDVARCVARRAGALLAESGAIGGPEDIFHLTADELRAGAPPPPAVLQERATLHEHFLRYRLPRTWTGVPEPDVILDADRPDDEPALVLTGIGVSDGTVTGRVSVIADPSVMAFEPGDVLVCETTDPSWASVMSLAGAIVVDIGAVMSHAAIVARELGVPCVVNTTDGSRRLRSGDLVRVDGTSGTVERLNGGGHQERP